LCEMLDVPVRAVNIPRQFVLAYFKPGYSAENLADPFDHIDFFIDPSSGQVFTHQDASNYFKRIGIEPTPSFFLPRRNKQVIRQLIEEFGRCFTGKDNYKQKELVELAGLLD
ncbi:MAG: hypothetical protein EOO09_20565, partial [Chitinophagaceae bacterium]